MACNSLVSTTNFVLRGNIIFSTPDRSLSVRPHAYLVCENGICAGVFDEIPAKYAQFPCYDQQDKLIIPGLVDLHIHAPQYGYRGLGMDLELLDWLETYTFPEESRYADLDYAARAYAQFVHDLQRSATTRAVCFGTSSSDATLLLMDLLEESGLHTMVGRVNMDRNCASDVLRDASAAFSLSDTAHWLEESAKYKRTQPIITPRFTPSCSDDLMQGLGDLAAQHGLPVQSHLNENLGEVAWVSELCPDAKHYTDTYQRANLLGNRTVLAHCVYMPQEECDMLRQTGTFVAHCPASNTNLASGIAPVRHMMEQQISIGLGSDVAGGAQLSIFRAMADAIQMSKLYWRLVDDTAKPLSVADAFHLATRGGGAYFGKVGAFEAGYAFDALVIDDAAQATPTAWSPAARLERVVYLCEDAAVEHKFVDGVQVF